MYFPIVADWIRYFKDGRIGNMNFEQNKTEKIVEKESLGRKLTNTVNMLMVMASMFAATPGNAQERENGADNNITAEDQAFSEEEAVNSFLNSKSFYSTQEFLAELEGVDTSNLTEEEMEEHAELLNFIKKDEVLQEAAEQERQEKRERYHYLPEELIEYIDVDPGDVLESESDFRSEYAALIKREQTILGGKNSPSEVREEFQKYEERLKDGTEAVPLQKKVRDIDSPVNRYDRALHVQRLVKLYEEGKIPADMRVNVSRKFENQAQRDAAVGRSLRFLGAKNFEDLSYEEKIDLEQKKISERFNEGIAPKSSDNESNKSDMYDGDPDVDIKGIREREDQEDLDDVREKLETIL